MSASLSRGNDALRVLTKTWFLTEGHRTRSPKDGTLLVLASCWRKDGMEVNQGILEAVAALVREERGAREKEKRRGRMRHGGEDRK